MQKSIIAYVCIPHKPCANLQPSTQGQLVCVSHATAATPKQQVRYKQELMYHLLMSLKMVRVSSGQSLFIVVRTVIDIMHSIAPYPTCNHHNYTPNLNLNLILALTLKSSIISDYWKL